VNGIRKAALIGAFWLFLVGLVIAEIGKLPSSGIGWGLLILLGPVGYLVSGAFGEFGMERLSAFSKRFGFGPLGRIALLLLILVPILALSVYLTNR
jgi:hypothetical protein